MFLQYTAQDSSTFFPQTNPEGLTTTWIITTIVQLLGMFCIAYFENYSDQSNLVEERLLVDGLRDTIYPGREDMVVTVFAAVRTCCSASSHLCRPGSKDLKGSEARLANLKCLTSVWVCLLKVPQSSKILPAAVHQLVKHVSLREHFTIQTIILLVKSFFEESQLPASVFLPSLDPARPLFGVSTFSLMNIRIVDLPMNSILS